MTIFHLVRATAILWTGLAWVAAPPVLAISPNQPVSTPVDSHGPAAAAVSKAPSYADLVDLIEPAPLIMAVQLRKLAQVEPERAKDVRAGWTRIYVEARGLAALRGTLPPVATLSYLADVRLDARGKLPELARRDMLLMARPVVGHPEMVQLVAPDAQLPWEPALAGRVRAILAALQASDAPSLVKNVREASYVPGELVGEGETQIFLATADGSPAAISVIHQPGKPVVWSVSFSEVVDASGQPPMSDTLAWYRLACFLPAQLPADSNVSDTAENRAQAIADYHLVMAGLGPCGRTRS